MPTLLFGFGGSHGEVAFEAWVLRDGCPRTVSGRERSSTKRNFPGAARVPESS